MKVKTVPNFGIFVHSTTDCALSSHGVAISFNLEEMQSVTDIIFDMMDMGERFEQTGRAMNFFAVTVGSVRVTLGNSHQHGRFIEIGNERTGGARGVSVMFSQFDKNHPLLDSLMLASSIMER